MHRPARLVLALVTPFVIAWSAGALATGSCSNGRTLYNKTNANVPTACSNSSCHGSKVDQHSIEHAAGNPTAIDMALDGNGSNAEMLALDLRNNLPLTASDIDDIATYVFFQQGVGGACPSSGSPNVQASPTSAGFGSVNVGSNATQTITISNTGTAAASSMNYTSAPSNAKFTKTGGSCTNGSLATGANCTVVLTYTPTSAGADSGTYTITGTGISIPISLSGTGVAASAPNVGATPTSLAFGAVNVGSSSPAQTITVSNTGSAAATNMSYPAAPARFTKGGTCSGTTLNAGASCSITFTYTPTSATADNATYTISGGGSSIPVSLSGSGTAPAPASLQAAPGSLAFGTVTVGSASAPQTLTVNNTGGSAASGVNIASGNAKFALSGSTCGAALAPGAACTVNVTYTPGAAGTDNANLTVAYSGGTPIVIPLSGSGTAAATANLSASPTTIAFGNITVGATSGGQTVTINNTGAAQATAVSVGSSNATKFPLTANTCGATLAAGASCTFTVAYAPSAAGAESGNVTVVYAGGANVVVSLSGTGTAAASASLSAAPPLVAFGNVTVGQTSAATTITVNNAGGAAASGVSFANSNAARFPVSGNNCGATINAGGSCSFSVAYAPGAAGADSGAVTMTYAGGGALTVSFTGTGVTGTPPPGTGQLSFTSALALPDTNVGATSAMQSVSVSNVGSAPVSVSSVASNNAEFAVASNTCGSVAAGGTCTIGITFSPSAAGPRSAVVTVTSNGAGNPHTLAVSGSGIGGGIPPPTAATALAIEYYHANFDHYFITTIADEITKLDNGTFVGWARTGRTFKVYPSAVSGLNAVCRFFSTAFNPKSSHFYTPNAAECTAVKANANWMFEAEVFWVTYPAVDGACPASTVPVYRVYNNGQGAAPNHRYTTDLAVRGEMIAKGWIPEGAGNVGVIMCTPQ